MESEADRMAAAALAPGAAQSPGTKPHREFGGGADYRSMHTGGRPLPDQQRAFFESRFGVDLSRVRLHTDAKAARDAKQLGARAFAHDQDIRFSQGRFQPGSDEGRRLLAHELAHTIQQSRPGMPAQIAAQPESGESLMWVKTRGLLLTRNPNTWQEALKSASHPDRLALMPRGTPLQVISRTSDQPFNRTAQRFQWWKVELDAAAGRANIGDQGYTMQNGLTDSLIPDDVLNPPDISELPVPDFDSGGTTAQEPPDFTVLNQLLNRPTAASRIEEILRQHLPNTPFRETIINGLSGNAAPPTVLELEQIWRETMRQNATEPDRSEFQLPIHSR